MLWQHTCAALAATMYIMGVLFLLLVEDSDRPGNWAKISLKGFNLGMRQGFMALAQLLCFGWLYYIVLWVLKIHNLPYAWCYLHSGDVGQFPEDADPGNFVGQLPFPPKGWPLERTPKLATKSHHAMRHHVILRSGSDLKGEQVVFERRFRPHGTSRVLALCSALTFLWGIPLVTYTGLVYYNSSPALWPACLTLVAALVGYLCFLLVPKLAPFSSTRLALTTYIGQVFLAPIWGVEFVHVLIGDALTSSVVCLYLLELTTCRAVTGYFQNSRLDTCADKSLLYYQFANPFMSALPFWIRSIQCMYKIYECKQKGVPWRNHALNLGKYSSALCLVIASVLQVTFDDLDAPYWTLLRFNWLAWLCIKTVYCTVWDIRMDWGLGEGSVTAKPVVLPSSVFAFSPSRMGSSRWSFDHFPSPRAHDKLDSSRPLMKSSSLENDFPWRLRSKRKFGSWFYYWALASNLVMRLSWSLTITSWSFYPDLPPSWSDILAFVEIGRRAQWMVIRIEFEYWNLRTKFSRAQPLIEEVAERPIRQEPSEPGADNEHQLLLFY
jgi:hypothetical protein